MIRLRFFARYAELVGREELELPVPGGGPTTVEDVVRRVRAGVPGAARLPERPLTAVNLRHVRLDAPVQDGDEVAFLPPLAEARDVPAGYTAREPISPAALLAAVAGPECGATCLFLGTVRDGPEDGGVTGIEYTAYETMAAAELDRITADARRQWPGVRLALRHRLGLVPTEEASIGIAAAAPHRADAFAACRYVIEEVKRRVPIWKKELRADGSVLWVDPQGRPAVVGPE